jgi:hypothetical protein
MIASRPAATTLFNAAYEAYTGIYSALEKISDELPPEELHAVKLAVGRVMGDILCQLTEPLIERHPELLPEEWKETDR